MKFTVVLILVHYFYSVLAVSLCSVKYTIYIHAYCSFYLGCLMFSFPVQAVFSCFLTNSPNYVGFYLFLPFDFKHMLVSHGITVAIMSCRFFYQNEIAYCSMCLLKEALHFNSISDYALPVVRLLTCNYLWKFVIVCYPTKTEFCVHKFWTNVYFFLIGLSTTHKMFTCYLKQSVVIQFE